MMKHSREEDLCRRGLLHLHPVEGVVYFPLRPGTPTQLQPPHEVLLVKATDYLDRLEDPEGHLSVAVAEPVQEVRPSGASHLQWHDVDQQPTDSIPNL